MRLMLCAAVVDVADGIGAVREALPVQCRLSANEASMITLLPGTA